MELTPEVKEKIQVAQEALAKYSLLPSAGDAIIALAQITVVTGVYLIGEPLQRQFPTVSQEDLQKIVEAFEAVVQMRTQFLQSFETQE